MTAPLDAPPEPRRRGPVLVDPGNERPALHPDYGSWMAAAKAPAPWRPWAAPPLSGRRRAAAVVAVAFLDGVRIGFVSALALGCWIVLLAITVAVWALVA